MSLTLLIGGARSGKSSLAVDIGHRHHAAGDAVTYVATAPTVDDDTEPVDDDTEPVDDDMAQRIERHRAERPPSWATIEEKHDLAAAVESVPSGLVIIDCLTLWTSNLMWDGLDDDAIRSVASTTAAQCAQRRDPVVAITNEVGLGVHPATELGRRYRDTLGWVNQTWAAAAGTALLLVAGKAIPLDDPWQTLGR